MVEEMYLEETKEQADIMESSDGVGDHEHSIARENNRNTQAQLSALHQRVEEHKPAIGQLVRIDSECLSSIITSPDKGDHHPPSRTGQSSDPRNQQDHSILQHGFGQVGDSFGAMELDFASYNHHLVGGSAAYSDQNTNHFGRGGVSLTLGLQQHGGSGGVSLAFTAASQSSLFYPRDHIEECQPVQHSLLDGEGQNLPYRNLMGAQLLHDLAG